MGKHWAVGRKAGAGIQSIPRKSQEHHHRHHRHDRHNGALGGGGDDSAP